MVVQLLKGVSRFQSLKEALIARLAEIPNMLTPVWVITTHDHKYRSAKISTGE